MLSLLLRPVRLLFDALLANDSPHELALGFTLGMLLGLVPKGNLIAVTLAVLLCALRAHRPAGLLAVAIFSLVGPLTDPLTHIAGLKLLELPPLQATYAWLYELPLGPYIGFHNTVTVGAFLLGLYLCYPCYYGSRYFFTHFGPPIARYIARYRLARVLAGTQFLARWEG